MTRQWASHLDSPSFWLNELLRLATRSLYRLAPGSFSIMSRFPEIPSRTPVKMRALLCVQVTLPPLLALFLGSHDPRVADANASKYKDAELML